MDIPKGFRPKNPKDLKDLLEGYKPKNPEPITEIEVSDYKRVRYTTKDVEYLLDYEEREDGNKWVLYEKVSGESRWVERFNLDETAKKHRLKILKPLIKFLDLKEEDYSLERDTAKTILDRSAIVRSGGFNDMYRWADRSIVPFHTAFYSVGDLSIKLSEYRENDP